MGRATPRARRTPAGQAISTGPDASRGRIRSRAASAETSGGQVGGPGEGRPRPPAPRTATPRSATHVNTSILNIYFIQMNYRICNTSSKLIGEYTISLNRIAIVFIKPLAPAGFRLTNRGRPPPRTRRKWYGAGGRGGFDAAKKAGGDGLTTGGTSRILGLAGREPRPDAEAAVRPRVGSSRDLHLPSAAMTRTPPATRQASRIRIARRKG